MKPVTCVREIDHQYAGRCDRAEVKVELKSVEARSIIHASAHWHVTMPTGSMYLSQDENIHIHIYSKNMKTLTATSRLRD